MSNMGSSSTNASSYFPQIKLNDSVLNNNKAAIRPLEALPLITTEEEFKNMENAVNNLLISKKQIDNLKSERNCLIQIYENKINEQNEKIKYLEEENLRLKKLTTSSCSNCATLLQLNDESIEHNNQIFRVWRKKYEQCLDNIMRQLLNSLKTQETIRLEFLKLEANLNDNSDNCTSSNTALNQPQSIDLNRNSSSFCTSNSWTFNSSSSNNNKLIKNEMQTNTNSNLKFHELLIQQQKQHLNLLNDLSEISKNLKINSLNTTLVFEPAPILSESIKQSTPPPPPPKPSSPVYHSTHNNSKLAQLHNKDLLNHSNHHSHFNNSNKNRQQGSEDTISNSKTYTSNKTITLSPNRFNNNATQLSVKTNLKNNNKNKLSQVILNDTDTLSNSNLLNTSLNSNSSKPSKIPKYNKNKSACSSTSSTGKVESTTKEAKLNSSNIKTNKSSNLNNNYNHNNNKRINQNQSKEIKRNNQQNKTNTSSNNNIKNNNNNQLSQKSKIPQRKTPQTSQTKLSKTDSARSSLSSKSNLNYNTYTKKKKNLNSNETTNQVHQEQQTIEQSQPKKQKLVNSSTFDKPIKAMLDEHDAKTNVEKISNTNFIMNECKEVKLLVNKNIVDILLVPVIKLNQQNESNSNSNNNKVIVRTRDDEGYSTMSSEIVQQIRLNQSNSSRSSTNNETCCNDIKTDSGIRISRASGDSTNIEETSSTTSTSLTHSPKPICQLIKETSVPTFKTKPNRRIKKRYCFPTLKTFNYYYNNRYYHQYHIQNQSENSLKSKSQSNNSNPASLVDPNICCKYLSDTDIQSLSNQLSSYDKDLSYNVYHLDTLYNNVDYILFNSYASDTELVYNYNRRNGRYQHFLNSNYKLYINDYFNQPYDEDDNEDDDDDDDDDDQEECDDDEKNEENYDSDNNSVQDTKIEANEEDSNEFENFNDEIARAQMEILADYELKDEEEYQFELDYTYNETEPSSHHVIELSVDDDDLLFDDEDVNLILMLKQAQKEKADEADGKSTNFNLNEYCHNMFESNVNSPIFSSQSLSSLESTKTSSSCSSDCASCSTSISKSPSTLSSTSELSLDSIDPKNKEKNSNYTTKKINHKIRKSSSKKQSHRHHHYNNNTNNNNQNRRRHHKHRHSRQHDYFTDSIDRYSDDNNNNYQEYSRDQDINENEENNELIDEKFMDNFDLDDFVQQLNIQCRIDKSLVASEKASKHLKELNMLAAARVVQETKPEVKQPTLVRRHTITTMPISAATLTYERNNCSNNVPSKTQIKIPASACQSPMKNPDSKAYVGSFTNPTNSRTSTPHRRASIQQKKSSQQYSQYTQNNYQQPQKHNQHLPLGNSITNTSIIQIKNDGANLNRTINSVGSTPVKVKNNFNNDFYRLCSETFYYGSDQNLLNNNKSSSSSSLQYQLQLIQQQSESEQQIGNNTNYQTNLTAHVNTLFDQWLLNSSSNTGPR